MDEEERALLGHAVNTWGEATQLDQLQEECGELVTAISHHRRARPGSVDRLAEELADVEIMAAQARIILESYGVDVDIYRWRKLDRLREQLDGGTS